MYPHWWNDVVTLFRKQETKDEKGKTQITWQRETLEGCFFSVKQKQVFDGMSLLSQNSYIVRIPAKYGIFHKGDIVVKSVTNAEVSEVKDMENAFTINVVKDNSKMRNAHYYGGEE